MTDNPRVWVKDGLWAIVFAGMAAAIIRFTAGLGAGTGLSDSTPWGLWIACKLSFVALAGGGFTVAAIVHILHVDAYRPILRRAILLALLGYGSFIVSLIFDLGLPWHVYMPIISWQHHSVMFEIAWCVMLYFSVLNLEFAPAVLENPWFGSRLFQGLRQLLRKATLPLVITGIVLSTLHQASLGSLFLIMPHRVHPMWYSPWLPHLFFASAIAAGMMALVLEGFLIERWSGRGMHFGLLSSLAKWAMLPLAIYLALRLADLLLRGVLARAVDGSWQGILFLIEIVAGGIAPLFLLAIKSVRNSRQGLVTSALLVVGGIVSQRMSLSMFTMHQVAGAAYTPSFTEVVIAAAIPAAALLVYLFCVENLPVVEPAVVIAAPPKPSPTLRPLSGHESPALRTAFARRSGLATFVLALVLPAMLPAALAGKAPAPMSVQPAKGWEVLLIDGDQQGSVVRFPHLKHQQRLADSDLQGGCRTCHHVDRPQDEMTACSECHMDYYRPSSIFDHSLHQRSLGGNAGCTECHTVDHTRESAQPCEACHEETASPEGQSRLTLLAPSYLDAMHGRCLSCHEEQADRQDRPELAQCATCHATGGTESDEPTISAFMP